MSAASDDVPPMPRTFQSSSAGHPEARRLRWTFTPFALLSPYALYELLGLRQTIFVVEQQCPYLDADGLDLQCVHARGHADTGELIAAFRLVPPGVRYVEASLGRVVCAWICFGQGEQMSVIMAHPNGRV